MVGGMALSNNIQTTDQNSFLYAKAGIAPALCYTQIYVEEFARSGWYTCKIEPDTSNDNDAYSMGMGTVQYILEIMK